MEPQIKEAVEILQKAEEKDGYGMLFTGGKDSMVMLHLWREHIGNQPPLLVIDTHNQFDEVYDFRSRIADEWDLELDVRANEEFLEEVINNPDDDRDFAWDGFKTEECCGALKIDVIADFISDGYEHLIVGRRSADLDRELNTIENNREPLPHMRYHPLASWPDPLVGAYLKREGTPLPSLYFEGYEHTDCVSCTREGEDNDEWSGMSPEKREQLNRLRDMGYM